MGTYYASDRYSLYVDALPHLVEEKSNVPVKGELYNVDLDNLKMLDELEGHPIFYKRQIIEIFDEKGNKRQAWAYIYPHQFKDKPELKEYEYE